MRKFLLLLAVLVLVGCQDLTQPNLDSSGGAPESLSAAVIDPGTRTVETEALTVRWSTQNPEAIEYLSFKGSPNLTKSAYLGPCLGHSYFGNSWANDLSDLPELHFVSGGASGTWLNPTSERVIVNSIDEGCFASAALPVETHYQFYAEGPAASTIKVSREIDFGSQPSGKPFRSYIPRLMQADYSYVLHPNAAGTYLRRYSSWGCKYGCTETDWDGTWFAIHNPNNRSGLIVRHVPSEYEVALWIDHEGGGTTSTSVLQLPPSGGFTGVVREVEFLCFYDRTTWTPSMTLPNGCDDPGPETSQVLAVPNPVMVNTPVTLFALVDETSTGGSTIASAVYSLDGTWVDMSAVDGTFDEITESVTATMPAFAELTVVDVCVRGTDSSGSTGMEACALLGVYDPTGGYVTGGGWIESYRGAFKPDYLLTGIAHFAFFSKYDKGASVPKGNASFRFKVADLDFRSTGYDWLVVNQGGTNAQFKGSGTINGDPSPTGEDYRFMIWAGDKDPDTFRIKIWYEDAGGVETDVYDNFRQQAIGSGSIVVHTMKKP